MIYHELKKYEAERGANKSTYWLFFELLWRDFFRLMGKKYEEKIFLKGGTKDEAPDGLRNNWQHFRPWLEGETGVPFIDANMRELNLTGFMSNRGRQNVASFLVKDLKINWQMGAEYFESMLIDYDVTSNWGNWNYVAGVGSDPREDRYFNIVKQARRYDPQGDYVRLWVPELSDLPTEFIHIPDQMQFAEQEEHDVKIGSHYPKAIVAKGADLLKEPPTTLQEKLTARLQRLSDPEIQTLNENIDLLVQLMDAEELDASPIITISEMNKPVQQPS
eukprot:g106.t1